jgi:hypothetical protein
VPLGRTRAADRALSHPRVSHFDFFPLLCVYRHHLTALQEARGEYRAATG